MKRYDIDVQPDRSYYGEGTTFIPVSYESVQGDWVRQEDVEALQALNAQMLDALEALLESAIQAEHFEHNSYNPPAEIHEMMANGDFSMRIYNAIAAINKARGEQQ